jgi:hypothetical protein
LNVDRFRNKVTWQSPMSGVGTFIVAPTATTVVVGRDCLMFIRSCVFSLETQDLTRLIF